jgi:hypothetical protein
MLRGAPIYRNAAPLQLGAYLMVHGPLKMDGGGLPFIKALKVMSRYIWTPGGSLSMQGSHQCEAIEAWSREGCWG